MSDRSDRLEVDHLGHLANLDSLHRLPPGIGDVDAVPPAAILRDSLKWLHDYVAKCDADSAMIQAAEDRVRVQVAKIREAVADRRAQAVRVIAEYESAARVLEMGVRLIDTGGNHVVFPAEHATLDGDAGLG